MTAQEEEKSEGLYTKTAAFRFSAMVDLPFGEAASD